MFGITRSSRFAGQLTRATPSFASRPAFQLNAKRLTQNAMRWLALREPNIGRLPPTMIALAANPGGATQDAAGIVGTKYVVEDGDYPVKIAQKLTGDQGRWKELVAANVPPKTRGSDGNFTSLYAGEQLEIPAAWWPIIATRFPGTTIPGIGGGDGTVPGTTPPKIGGGGGGGGIIPGDIPGIIGGIIPGIGGGTGTGDGGAGTGGGGTGTTTTYPPGMVLQAQMMTAAWSKKYPGALTPRYGQVTDFNGSPTDNRFSFALSEFQKWSNANRGTALTAGGQFDQPTYDALTQWFAAETKTPPVIGGGDITSPPIVPGVTPGVPGGTMPGIPGGTVPGLPGTTPPGTMPGTPPATKKSDSGIGILVVAAAAAYALG